VSNASQRSAVEPGLLRGVQVLVIDDDSDARELLAAVLEYCGAHVVSAESARAGLAVLGRSQPDVVVCDLVMPGDDGYALIRTLRARERERRVPVIALTAYGFAYGAEEVLAAGFDAFLRKPVEPWELCRTVDRLRRGGGAP
jgi:CheY-like chemotaxis protein